jgi:hypothetical protein
MNSLTRKELAYAYGFADFRPIRARIREKIHTLTDEQLEQLGNWTGSAKLLPKQVEIIVLIMGKPARPEVVYNN